MARGLDRPAPAWPIRRHRGRAVFLPTHFRLRPSVFDRQRATVLDVLQRNSGPGRQGCRCMRRARHPARHPLRHGLFPRRFHAEDTRGGAPCLSAAHRGRHPPGLEFLVAGDIIRTVALGPTITNTLVLGMIILIRTFLSFTIEIDLRGRLPWHRTSGTG
jgi:hypothetical protein